MQLAGKVALVTGAGSGIGRATALTFANEGARVAVVELLAERANAVADEINQVGGEAIPLVADVAQAAEVERAVRHATEHFGRLDIVFANAGINGVWAPIEELTPEEWDRTLDINLKGCFHTIKYAVPWLKKAGGAIVVTSSVNGTRVFSNSGAVAYSCAKAGQLVMAKMLAPELAPYGVRINAICPGSVQTNIRENTFPRNREAIRWPVQYPKGPIPLKEHQPATPEQVAQLVLFLASDNASHITGTEVWIDGGQSLVIG
ncbi:MAG: 3-oxoacyl-[acyl-carrier-protein] reductase [Chloroflexi bacterium]|nr:MAG: 3-oxoacyl-[acyl-carrier-protein] reductase [Chloroflexota bacterium]